MSDFKNELIRSTVSKATFDKDIYSDFEKGVSAVIKKTIDETFDRIKEKIRQSSKTSQYEEIGNMKTITGYIYLSSARYCMSFSEEKRKFLIEVGKSDEIQKKYLTHYPNIHLNRDRENSSNYEFSCNLMETIKHNRLFGNPSFYHSYHLTDLAKNIINEIGKLAARDEISVSFSHIELGLGGNGPTIEDGGNNKHLKQGYTMGHIVLKYSISF